MNNKETIRVLHVTEMLSAAGIESFIMNNYRNINRDKVQFDFLVLRNEKEFYDDEIKSLGGIKYYVHSEKKNTLLRILDESQQIKKFLKNNKYDIIHVHYTTPLRAFYLKAAKEAGVPVRIYHSHSAEVLGKSRIKLFIYNFCKHNMKRWGTHFFACSRAAADWMYPKDLLKTKQVKILHNGIDTNRFEFDDKIRREKRNELKLDKKFVLINTGRFTEQKNQSFILDIIIKLKSKGVDIKLLLLGEGPLENEYREKVNRLGLGDEVIFLGVRKNVQDYLFAADCFVMPSLYEGLPVAAIEAQCTGIPCVLSTNITDEAKITENVMLLNLNNSIDEWQKTILNMQQMQREKAVYKIRDAGYDIKNVAKRMEEFYLSVI